MGNHRIKLVTSGNSTLQFFRLTQNQPFGSYQRYLVGNTDNQFLLIERLRDEVIRANLKPLHNICRTIQCGQKDDWNISCIRI